MTRAGLPLRPITAIAALTLAVGAALASGLAASCGEDVTLGCNAPPSPCAAEPCGTSCNMDSCAEACEAPCPIAGTCDGKGTCVTTPGAPPVCPMTNPCDGKSCGDGCAPDETPPPPGDHACDVNGSCSPAPVSCPPPNPCAGMTCGAACNPCTTMVDGGCPPPPHPMECDMTQSCVDAPAPCP